MMYKGLSREYGKILNEMTKERERRKNNLESELKRMAYEYGVEKPGLLLKDLNIGEFAGLYDSTNKRVIMNIRYLTSYITLYHEFKHHLQYLKAGCVFHKAFGRERVLKYPHRERPHEIDAEQFAIKEYKKRCGITCFMCREQISRNEISIKIGKQVKKIIEKILYCCDLCWEKIEKMTDKQKRKLFGIAKTRPYLIGKIELWDKTFEI